MGTVFFTLAGLLQLALLFQHQILVALQYALFRERLQCELAVLHRAAVTLVLSTSLVSCYIND